MWSTKPLKSGIFNLAQLNRRICGGVVSNSAVNSFVDAFSFSPFLSYFLFPFLSFFFSNKETFNTRYCACFCWPRFIKMGKVVFVLLDSYWPNWSLLSLPFGGGRSCIHLVFDQMLWSEKCWSLTYSPRLVEKGPVLEKSLVTVSMLWLKPRMLWLKQWFDKPPNAGQWVTLSLIPFMFSFSEMDQLHVNCWKKIGDIVESHFLASYKLQ